LKLNVVLQQARDLQRAKHLAYSTEKAYLGWIERYAAWLKSHPDQGGAASVEAFLTHLAVEEHVSASTQNQAFSALLFLYRDVLKQDPGAIHAVRAKRGVRVPIALTHAEALRLINALRGDYQLLAQLMYGSGLRVMEALRLRAKDVNVEKKVPIHEVKELMGHASIETTMIYLHAVEHSGHTIVSPLDT